MPKTLSGDTVAGIVDAGLGFRHGSTTMPTWTVGAGSPEGVVSAVVGSLWSRTDGGTDSTLYRKETGAAAATGWVATAAGATGGPFVKIAGDNMTGNLGFGVSAPTAKVHLAVGTTPAGGIQFGDTNLYHPTAALTIQTDNSFVVGGTVNSTARMGIGVDANSGILLRVGSASNPASVGITSGTFNGATTATAGASAVVATATAVAPSGTTTALTGVQARTDVTAANVVTDARALYVVGPTLSNGGTISTAYGLDVAALKVAGVTTAYGVYQRGASDLNYFAGPITQGSVPATSGALRLSTNTSISWRNAGNSADIAAITVNSADALVLNVPSGSNGFCQVNGVSTLRWNATQLILGEGVNFSVGNVTGTKFGVNGTQKLAWWTATPVVQDTGWSVTAGYTADKAFNPATTTLAEVANVLGTLIDTLKTYGLLGT